MAVLLEIQVFTDVTVSICEQLPTSRVGRDSSVGIATRYRLDGPGKESRYGRDFPHASRPALRHT